MNLVGGTFATLQVTVAGVEPTDPLSLVCTFCGVWMTSHVFAVWGVRREFRQLEGSE